MFIAKKPCKFAGVEYLTNDPIPEGVVLPEAVTRLIKNGVIAEVGEAGPLLPASTSLEIEVPIVADEGETSVTMTKEELVDAVRTIQKTDEEIIEAIKEIEKEDVLIFIDVIKGVYNEKIHTALETRAKELFGEPEQSEGDEDNQEPQEKYTMNSLMKLNRENLVEVAKEFEIEVNEETKREIAELILAKQGE